MKIDNDESIKKKSCFNMIITYYKNILINRQLFNHLILTFYSFNRIII